MRSLAMRWVLSLSSIISLQLGSLPVCGRPIKGFDVSQVSQYQGRVHMRVTPAVARIDSDEYTVVLLPNSRTLVYNNANKTYCEKRREEWLRQFGGTEKSHSRRVRKAKTEMIAGRHSTKYICERLDKKGRLSTTTEFWTCSDLPITAENASAYCVFCDVPAGYGLPMRIMRNVGSRQFSMLDTLACRPASFDPSVFKPLSGFKKVKDEMELMMSGASGSGKDDFATMFSDDSPSPKAGKSMNKGAAGK